MRNWTEEINETVNIFKKCNYGDVIEHTDISTRIGIYPNMPEYLYIISKAKLLLIEKGIYIKTLSGVGYRVLYPNEISEEVFNKYIKAGIEKYRYGINIMSNTPQKLLNQEELKEFEEVEKLIRKLYSNNINEVKDMQFRLNSNKFKSLTE